MHTFSTTPAGTSDARSARDAVEQLRRVAAALRGRLGAVVLGQEEAVELLVTAVLCGGHALMVGVPGLGKTLLVRTLAQALGWRFGRVQFTPDLMPADITGTQILQQRADGGREMTFQRGPIFTNLLLADEINRTPPKTQAALLEAMQERAVTVGGQTYPLDEPFVVVATHNPIEQAGTYPLPEAQLDRFMLSVHLAYPDRAVERQVALRPPRMAVPRNEPVATPDAFAAFTAVIDAVPVADDVLDYAVALVAATRPGAEADAFVQEHVTWGAGPRATQHLVTAARAAALLDGRPAPEVDDIKRMAAPTLRHRLVLSYAALGAGVDAEAVMAHVVERTPRP